MWYQSVPPDKMQTPPSAAGRRAGAGLPKVAAGGALNRKPVRPASAPSLLRGDGLIARRPYEDEFRQGIEDSAVRGLKQHMRREGHVQKALVNSVDTLSDQTLFDLKVLHNSAQRARSASAGRRRTRRGAQQPERGLAGRPAESPSEKLREPNSEKLRELNKYLDSDIKGHCRRLGVPPKCIAGPRLLCVEWRLQMLQKLGSSAAYSRLAVFSGDVYTPDDPRGGVREVAQEMRQIFKGRRRRSTQLESTKTVSDAEALPRLADFLTGSGGRLGPTLQAMDINGRGRMSQEDFAVGLEMLGFNAASSSQVWRLLDTEGAGVLSLSELEGRLLPHFETLGQEKWRQQWGEVP